MAEATQAPGWYRDPENAAHKRYWNGSEFTGESEPNKPAGWYPDPMNPSHSRYWDGATWITPPMPPAPAVPTKEANDSDRQLLWWGYILGAIIPIFGWATAIYIGVSEKRARIRRHAFGIAAVAITAAVIYVVIIVNANQSHRDGSVATDLQSLLADHGVTATGISCAHENANLYTCSAMVNGQQEFAQVTDDGQSIYELGISTSGG